MKEQQYNIGQILFILSQKYNKVIPVKITEHIISKTVDGEKSKYIVTPYFNKSKQYNLEQLSGKILFNTKDVYNYMLNNASSAIKGIIEESVENAKLLGYSNDLDLLDTDSAQESETSDVTSEATENVETKETIEEPALDNLEDGSLPETITLPDGTVAKVNIK